MHHGNKSEIQNLAAPPIALTSRPNTSTAVLDCPVVVQMLRPKIAVTSVDYFTKIFSLYNFCFMENNQRVDLIWDVYFKDINSTTDGYWYS